MTSSHRATPPPRSVRDAALSSARPGRRVGGPERAACLPGFSRLPDSQPLWR